MSETETAPETAAEAEIEATETPPEAEAAEAATEADADGEPKETEEERAARLAERKKRILKRSLIQTAVVLLLPALAFLGLAFYKARKVDLIVDNGNKFPVKLFVNGKELTTIPRRDHRIVKNLSGGHLTLLAVEQGPGGEQGRKFTLAGDAKTELFAERRATYVWNIDGATPHYHLVVKDYDSEDRRVRSVEKKTFDQQLFRLPDDILPQLNAGFPKARQVEQGGKRQMLWTAAYVGRIESNRAAARMVGSNQAQHAIKKAKAKALVPGN